ncbi:MAG: hypothetical protein GWN01_02860 [Nitrosopumilaceae archaeon]|nr:hypothetical protein [Nitrosopumilaceae archaeon]NIT99906.1 hypothetical protein [Nitrosopumilaceae archaeon]NIU86260.1 hypothetical protein [Nitrosopumilaceae archaeon]NIV65015.1 hypothetical protein [Nitrosopumilaceae archaeon]NIX60509.1 hypothetical protein [Nitrosopumilaceae archaeon]
MNSFFIASIIFSFTFMLIFQGISIAYAEEAKIKLTSDETLKVRFATEPSKPEPNSEAKMKIDFLKKESEEIQEHIDYTLSVTKSNEELFNVKLTHTSTGAVTIPYQFPENGKYTITINVSGILFQPIPEESVSFPVSIGDESDSSGETKTDIPQWIKNNAGWWADGQIGDSDFVQGIQWLIKNGIMKI